MHKVKIKFNFGIINYFILQGSLKEMDGRLFTFFGLISHDHDFIIAIHTILVAIIAVILAFPVFRVRGDYLAIVTLGFGFIIKILAINKPEWTNGAIGLNEIPNNHDSVVGYIERTLLSLSSGDSALSAFFKTLYAHAFSNGANITVFFWSGILATASVILILQIVYSKYGRAMKAVRDDEDAAIAMGVNTFKIKTFAFSTSAFCFNSRRW